MNGVARQGLSVQLVSRPEGVLERGHFAIVDMPAPHLPPGWVLVHNRYVALDPHPAALAARHWPLHRAVSAGSLIGEVVASRSADLPPGSLIAHRGGWSTYSALPRGGHSTRVLRPPAGVPVDAYLTVLGLPGLAAHVGLTSVLKLGPGESLFIAGAADPVGTATARIARMLGASRIVGGVTSPGGAGMAAQQSCFDAVFESRPGQGDGTGSSFRHAGVDAAVVGGAGTSLADALHWVRDLGRIAWLHGSPAHPGDRSAALDLSPVHRRGIRVEGFGLQHHLHRLKEIEHQYVDELSAGRLHPGKSLEVDFDRLVDVLIDATRSGFQPADTYRLVG